MNLPNFGIKNINNDMIHSFIDLFSESRHLLIDPEYNSLFNKLLQHFEDKKNIDINTQLIRGRILLKSGIFDFQQEKTDSHNIKMSHVQEIIETNNNDSIQHKKLNLQYQYETLLKNIIFGSADLNFQTLVEKIEYIQLTQN